MSRPVLRLSDFGKMSEPEKLRAISDLVRAAREPANGHRAELELEIRAYERRYEMSSSMMRERLAAGILQETEDICHWLIALELRGRLREQARP